MMLFLLIKIEITRRGPFDLCDVAHKWAMTYQLRIIGLLNTLHPQGMGNL